MVLTAFFVFCSFSRHVKKYRITKRVGGGSFGDIYLGVGANGEKVGHAAVGEPFLAYFSPEIFLRRFI
jgi:lipopolysaccharide export LptBFGC system permease protein LptF